MSRGESEHFVVLAARRDEAGTYVVALKEELEGTTIFRQRGAFCLALKLHTEAPLVREAQLKE
jgi:hypothetical protein